jgi:nucleoside-diphosphate-sugar epimerase
MKHNDPANQSGELMRVFVTGANGFVGSAIVEDLIQAGHTVLGLVRSDKAADAVLQMGAEVHRGDLSDEETLTAGARVCDGVIHTAFSNDFSQFEAAGETDRRALGALGAALSGTGRPLVITSAIGLLAPGEPTTEDDAGDPNSPGAARIPSEEKALALASEGVRSCIVRLPFMVHDRTKQGLATRLMALARQTDFSAYVGDGVNRWSAVHRLDAARLYRLALENGTAGSKYHAIAEDSIPLRDIAEAIGKSLNVPVRAISPAKAAKHFGFLTYFVSSDFRSSSEHTKQTLGWDPVHPGVIADLEPTE